MNFNVDVAQKKVLVVEEMAKMRTQIQGALMGCGFEHIQTLGSAKEAINKVDSVTYDLIICEYSFSDGPNGQQFLEYMRNHEKLPSNSIFIMVTAENTYEKIVAAAEHLPDTYLLKPFSTHEFTQRIERLIEKQATLSKIDRAYDEKNWQKVVTECNKLISTKNPYLIDLLRLKGGALLKQDKPDMAIDVYKEALSYKDVPWAHLGIAQGLVMQNNLADAKVAAKVLMRQYPQYLAAYDFMSELHIKENLSADAQGVLQTAATISPISLGLNRQLSAVAMTNGQYEFAEQNFSNVLKHHKNSPATLASDYALLSRAMLEQNKVDQALDTLKSVRNVFNDKHSEVVLACAASIAHRKAGNLKQAETELMSTMAHDHRHLPPQINSALADAYFAAGHDDKAMTILKHMLQNNPHDLNVEAKVKMTCALAGKSATESSAIILESEREIIRLNNEGVRKAQTGAYKEAVAMLTEAADHLPNNLLIASNAAFVLAASLAEYQHDDETMRKCLEYRQRLAEKDPAHPKLERIDAMLRKAKAMA